MVGLIFWPFVSAIMLSTTAFNFNTGETFSVGFRNYQRLLSNSDFILSLQNTINFTFWSLSIKFVVGMTLALILNSRLPFRALLSGIMLLPWIVPEIVTALAWKSIYDPLFGGLNPILQGIGIIDRPLGWLSRSAHGDGQRHLGQRVEGHSVLRAAAACRASRQSRRNSSRRPRSTAPTWCSASGT